jgi:hypothetical protein
MNWSVMPFAPVLPASKFPNAIVGDPNGRPVMISASVMAYTDANHVPQQVTLTPSGTLTVSTPGTTVQLLNFSDQLKLDAANITVKQCALQFSGAIQIFMTPNAVNCVIEDCFIDGQGIGGGNAIFSESNGASNGSQYLRNNITRIENGVDPGDGDLIQDNYIHDLLSDGSPHYDGIQINGGSNITIRHNTVQNPFGFTSNINLSNSAPITNILCDNNQLLGPSLQFQFYMDGSFTSGSLTANWTNNVIQLAPGQGYDFIRPGTASPFSFTHSGNTDYNTGVNIDGLL